MADDIDDDDDEADESPMVPAFLANMTDEERQAFVTRFNSAKVTSVVALGRNGVLVEYERIACDGPPVEESPFVVLDIRPYLDNEGKVSR